MSHTNYQSVFKEKVKGILALSPVLLGVPTKKLGVQSNSLLDFGSMMIVNITSAQDLKALLLM